MSEDPTIGELARRQADDREAARRGDDQLDKRIAELADAQIGQRVYDADRRWLDERFAVLQAAIDTLGKALDLQESRSASQKLVLLTGLVFPIIVAVVTAAIVAFLAAR